MGRKTWPESSGDAIGTFSPGPGSGPAVLVGLNGEQRLKTGNVKAASEFPVARAVQLLQVSGNSSDAFAAPRQIASNGSGTILIANSTASFARSTDNGATFSPVAVPVNFCSIAYGAGLFVGVYNNSNQFFIYSSPDGVTWTVRVNAGAIVPTTFTELTHVVYENGVFIALCGSASSGGGYVSADGINWSARAITNMGNAVPRMLFGGGVWIAFSGAGTTTNRSNDNGATFVAGATLPATPSGQFGAYFGGKFYIPIANGRFLESSDGVTWTTSTTLISPNGSSGALFAFGSTLIFSSNLRSYFTTTDGVNWTYRGLFNSFSQANTTFVYRQGSLLFVGGASQYVSRVADVSVIDFVGWPYAEVTSSGNSAIYVRIA